MINQTSQQYDQVIQQCQTIFINKNKDYGTSWRIMRLTSIMDQIFIKAQRIRNIEESGIQKIGDDIASEFMGIINYCVMGLIQLQMKDSSQLDLNNGELSQLYMTQVAATKTLMEQKNHDYGEVWRAMKVSTFTDILLVRLLRIRQIDENKGATIMSEGIDANLQDMINYSVFALIRLNE